MSRGLCVLAALAILAGGCASRRAVDRLESEVGRLRSELAEIRVGQEATSRGIANITSQLQTLDIPALGDEVARLTRRADATEMTLAATRTQVEGLTPQRGASSAPAPAPTPAPTPTGARPPAPLPPSSATTSPVPAPLPPDRAVMTPAPTPQSRSAAVSPPPAPAPPPAATMLPSPTLSPTSAPPPAQPPSAAVEKPRVTPPTSTAPSTTTVTPAKPASKPGGNPEQEYAAALATYRAREHGQAVIDFLDFIAKYPKHPLAGNAQYWIGEAYWAQRDYRQALVEFEKVFEHGPGKAPDALLKIGLCYLRLSDVPRAQQAWQRVVNEYPKSESASMARSLIATHSSARR